MKNEGLNKAFACITEEKARDWYRKRYLKTPAYLIIINNLLVKNGQKFPSDDIKGFCKEWDIKESSFYWAITKLKEDGIVLYEPKKADKGRELEVQLNLQSSLGGQREVKTESGFIDLLTDTQIIEVKEVSAWKDALGQVMSYGIEYPNHEKRIHLFGESDRNLDHISDVCSQYGIVVTFEQVNP